MTPPPSPVIPSPELNKDAVPPASFYGHLPPPKRAGSQHTTFTTIPPAAAPAAPTAEPGEMSVPRSTAPSPELPPYSPTVGEAFDPDYKDPTVLPESPDPALASGPALYGNNDWAAGAGEREGEWGPIEPGPEAVGVPWGAAAVRSWSPDSMEVSARQSPTMAWDLGDAFGEAFANMEGDEVLAPQYGDGLVQEKLVAELCSWTNKTYTPAVEAGRDVGELWSITVLQLPEYPTPPAPVAAAPPAPAAPSTPDSDPASPTVPSTSAALSASGSTVSMSTFASLASAASAGTDTPATTSTPPRQLHVHNPPTIPEIRALLPYPLHLSIPFLPHAWLPVVTADSDYPKLSVTPSVPLPQHSPDQKACHSTSSKAHHFHLLPTAVPPSSALRLPPPAEGTTNDLDLWYCCQCRTHVLAPNKGTGGPRIPTVIDNVVFGQYVEDRMQNPPAGLTGPEAIIQAIEVLLKMNEGLLWAGRNQCVKVRNPTFNRKVGWNDTVAQIMTSMGWTISSESAWLAALNPSAPNGTLPEPADSEAQVLVPPAGVGALDSEMRKTLLMAWIELGAFALVWRRRYPTMKASEFRFCVEVHDARELLDELLGVPDLYEGGHWRQVPANLKGPFEALGLASRYSPKLLKTAYEMQCRCYTSRRTQFFDCISHIYETTTQDDEIAVLLAEERSRGRHTTLEVHEAYAELGFGEESELMLLGEEVDDQAVWMAFEARADLWSKLGLQSAYPGPYAPPPGPPPDVDMDESQRGRSLTRAGAGTPHPSHPDWSTRNSALPRDEVKRHLRLALDTISEARNSAFLKNKLKDEAEKKFGMDLDTAYGTLGVMAETDDEMVLAVFQTRCSDAPAMQDRMLDALKSIATARQSQRLIRFLETGDPQPDAPTVSVVPLEFPRGLDQLGNTCYLNSLLQYFYTIRELRESVVDNSKLVDENELIESGALETMRVGGRLVTKREIARSAEFVRLLGVLFMQLSVAETPSVTPELQLAKLALVTSQDEEEDKQLQQPLPAVSSPVEMRQDTAPSSDATLVDDPMHGGEPTGAHTSTAEATNENSPSVEQIQPSGAPTVHSTPSATPGAESVPASSPPPAEESASTAPPGRSPPPPFDHLPSVLGKRDRNSSARHSRSVMDIESIVDPPDVVKSPKRANTLPPTILRSDEADVVSFKRAATEPMDVDPVEAKQDEARTDVEMTADDNLAKEQVNGTDETANPSPERPTRPPPLPPRASTKKVEGQSESFMMFGRQHDVSECMDNCMFQIEAALKPDPGVEEASLVKRLFYGKLRQRVTSDDESSAAHMRDDPFAHIHVNVGDEGFDLYDGLGGYFADEVEYEGRMAKMDVTLVELPQLLQVQLQRVQFNRETFQAYKSNAYVKFDETLYLDRFLESADRQKRERSKTLRKQLDECRDEIRTLTQDKAGPFLAAMDNTRKFLDEQKLIDLPEWNSDLSKMLDFERQALNRQIEELRARATSLKEELESIWADDRSAEYELSSVFIHRGNHAFGHYWLYSRVLPDNPDQWLKYNDSTVTAVQKSEVLGDLTGSTANPYLLVYAKKGSDAIHTVHRLV